VENSDWSAIAPRVVDAFLHLPDAVIVAIVTVLGTAFVALVGAVVARRPYRRLTALAEAYEKAPGSVKPLVARRMRIGLGLPLYVVGSAVAGLVVGVLIGWLGDGIQGSVTTSPAAFWVGAGVGAVALVVVACVVTFGGEKAGWWSLDDAARSSDSGQKSDAGSATPATTGARQPRGTGSTRTAYPPPPPSSLAGTPGAPSVATSTD
jgi:F0F1-type ATP synthase assembly protein I